MSHYYDRSHLPRFGEIRRGNRELARQYFAYYAGVFEAGAQSKREKALAALAVAHAVQCPYCIDAYVDGALSAGSDLEQMAEAVHVASAVRGGSSLLYGQQMLCQAGYATMHPSTSRATSPSQRAYFDRAHLDTFDGLADGAPALAEASQAYDRAVFSEGALEVREKALIALAVAHAVQCPYSIERFTRLCLDHGCSLEEMTEAVHVANAIRGGASLVHGLQMLEHVTKTAM